MITIDYRAQQHRSQRAGLQDRPVGSDQIGATPSAPIPTETTAPAKRRERARNTRRPASGLVPAVPVFAASSGCDEASTEPAERPYRMSRRARLTITLTVLTAAVVIGINALVSAPAGVTTVTVTSGDTLWSIAERAGANSDVRATIDEITEMNGLTSILLLPGQVLVVPVG